MAQKSSSVTAAAGRAEFWLNRAARAAHEPEGRTRRTAPGPLRISVRRQTAFSATLNYGLTDSVVLHVRDLSPTDAFVEMDGPELAVGAAVEFVLRGRYRDRPVELRVAANVVRVDADGMALHFGSYDDDTYTSLVKLLYAA